MSIAKNIFHGCMPALMTPCDESGVPNIDALAAKGSELIEAGMGAVVYCGSMGDWPLLDDSQREAGVVALREAGVPVVVGTGAQNTARAVQLTEHARDNGASGLMLIPRVLSRGTSAAAQREHFLAILEAAGDVPAVIYNSPYYGFETRAELFFELHEKYNNLVGFKEFGGAASLTYAAENITGNNPELVLMVGVDTQVVHGYVRCGAKGAITGVGNALPAQVLRLIELSERAATGDTNAMQLASELDTALMELSKLDEGPELVLFYKRLMVLEGHSEYAHHINKSDALDASQEAFIETEWRRFRDWWSSWPGATD
jgi:dihydrodipicolinate synthase/N-acetylneuraminate lyase